MQVRHSACEELSPEGAQRACERSTRSWVRPMIVGFSRGEGKGWATGSSISVDTGRVIPLGWQGCHPDEILKAEARDAAHG